MSHYIYKKKKFLELPDGRILPLCLYADSSVTSNTYDRYGRRHEYNPRSWCIHTMNAKKGILIDKQEFKRLAEEAYNQEMNSLREYRKKYVPEKGEPDGDSYCYYGTVYPAGRRMKDMKSFYSVRRTIPAEEFLATNRFSINISLYDSSTFETLKTETIHIKTVYDLVYAENVYEDMFNNKTGGICTGISGLLENSICYPVN